MSRCRVSHTAHPPALTKRSSTRRNCLSYSNLPNATPQSVCTSTDWTRSPTPGRQLQIVDLARAAVDRIPNLQVVFTARDHVVGPWLNGIVRLSVDELNGAQQRSLVHKWLESDEATERFFE